jgi:hypothetical protein
MVLLNVLICATDDSKTQVREKHTPIWYTVTRFVPPTAVDSKSVQLRGRIDATVG